MKQKLQVSFAGIFGLLIITAIGTCVFPQEAKQNDSDSNYEKMDEGREDDTSTSSKIVTDNEYSDDLPSDSSSSEDTKSFEGKSRENSYSGSKSSKSKSLKSKLSRKTAKKKAKSSKHSDRKCSYGNGYDDGYDDIEMNQDYDEERYDNDGEYAEGVDDAMEEAYYEYGEEW